MGMPFVLVRMDVLVHEGGHLLAQVLHLRCVVEVHAALLTLLFVEFFPPAASPARRAALSCLRLPSRADSRPCHRAHASQCPGRWRRCGTGYTPDRNPKPPDR